MKRRAFFKRSLQSVLGVGLLSGFYAWQIEPFMLVFETLNMPLLNMPKELVGKTVMQISDVHVGNRVDADYLIESFKKAQAYKPDIVVYTGDFVHYEDAAQLEQLKTVFKHCVTGSMATLGVLGNHDYGLDWNEEPVAKNIIAILKANNVSILRNETTAINGLQIVGIDDFWGTNFKPKKALESTSDNLPTICLCHNPDVCDLPVWGNFKGWILSGHTHGGQVKIPFLNPPVLPVKNKRYSAGKIPLSKDRTLYINRALGHLYQVRFNVRPEITVFTLTNA